MYKVYIKFPNCDGVLVCKIRDITYPNMSYNDISNVWQFESTEGKKFFYKLGRDDRIIIEPDC